jgi:hypothetical protein
VRAVHYGIPCHCCVVDRMKNHFILSIPKRNGMSPIKVALRGSHVLPTVCVLLSATKRLSDFHEIRRWGALQKKRASSIYDSTYA